MMEKMTFMRAKSLAKVVYTMETGVLNIQTPVRITSCPLRLQLQTSWIVVIMMGIMKFRKTYQEHPLYLAHPNLVLN